MLVGRPNVGKSTLFNRVTRTRRAIVTAIPGTTRDVLAQPVEWEGTPLRAHRYGRDVRRERGPAARARAGARSTCDWRRRSPCARCGWPRRTGRRRSRDRSGCAGRGKAGAARREQDRRPVARAVARSRCISSDSIRCSRSPPNTGTVSATCSMRSSTRCPLPALRRQPRRRMKWRSPSSVARMRASPRWSIGCFEKSG